MADTRGRDEDGKGNVSPGPARPVWVWILIVIFVIALIWFGIWIFGGHNGYQGMNRPNMTPTASVANTNTATQAANANTVVGGTGLPILDAANKQQYVGQSFDVSNVHVTGVPSHGAFWISASDAAASSNAAPMLVLITANTDAKANPPTQGQLVDVTGTIVKAPPSAQAKKEWSLSDSDAAQLEKQGAYVQATNVAPAQPNTGTQPASTGTQP